MSSVGQQGVSADWGVALRLGRVSNLPTVWTNVLAGGILAGADPAHPLVLVPLLAASLLYVGGMYLNDAFDAEIDAAIHGSDGALSQLEPISEPGEIAPCPDDVHGHRLIGVGLDRRVARQEVG